MKDAVGKVTHYVAHFLDLTDIRHAESNIGALEDLDPLTGLSNRRGFSRLIDSRKLAMSEHEFCFLLLIDMDQFKKVNDSVGYSFGDQLLQAVARRLLHITNETSSVARLAGDEFGLLHVPGLVKGNQITGAAEFAEKVRETLRAPYDIDEHTIYASASVGVCVALQGRADWEEMLKGANLAMNHAKRKGGNRVEFFNPNMLIQAKREYLLVSDLRRVIEGGQLLLYIQGQFDRERRLVGAEVLSRWQWRGEWVSPSEFVGLAERSNLIIDLDLQILQRSLEKLAEWNEKEVKLQRLSINISARHLRQEEFAGSVQQMIENSGVNPSWVVLEITENALLEGTNNVHKNLAVLTTMGIGISLDDFGTGYSCLSNITTFPITEIKIDRSFVQDLTQSMKLQVISGAAIELGSRLALNVVAEGVENAGQFRVLRNAGCPVFQGYYFMRPEPIDDFWQRL